jgi:hypothetical protein
LSNLPETKTVNESWQRIEQHPEEAHAQLWTSFQLIL